MAEERAKNKSSWFEIICSDCRGIGIILGEPISAPGSTIIKCRHCGADRGTLGGLRSLSLLGKQDLFEI